MFGLITLIITIILKEYRKDFAIFSVLIGGAIILYISLDKHCDTGFISVLLKITGISILTEYAVSICKDSGESSIASKIDLGGKIMVISMSIPVISTALESLTRLLP